MRLRKLQVDKCSGPIDRTLWSFYYISDLMHVCSTKVKLKSFELKFCLQIDPTVIRISRNFRKEQMCLSPDIQLSKNIPWPQKRQLSSLLWKLNISRKIHSSFRKFLAILITVGSIYRQNFKSKLFNFTFVEHTCLRPEI
jgi:hypothetical protein